MSLKVVGIASLLVAGYYIYTRTKEADLADSINPRPPTHEQPETANPPPPPSMRKPDHVPVVRPEDLLHSGIRSHHGFFGSRHNVFGPLITRF